MTSYQNAIMKKDSTNMLPATLGGKLAAFILLITLVMTLLLFGINAAFAQIAGSPLPKPNVTIRGEHIRLGDVFEGLSQHADFVLAPAPAPGQDLVWNAPTLMRIATAFNMPWRPGNTDEVHIRRAAYQVEASTIRALIQDHLAFAGDSDSYDITFATQIPNIIVPSDNAPDLKLTDFQMHTDGGPFSAIVSVRGQNGTNKTITLRGNAEHIRRLPVLNKTIAGGTIITNADIMWVERPAANVRADVLADISQIVGSTPRRGIQAGAIMRPDDLALPLLVKRGDVITMVFKKGGMYLTAKGRAMADGAKGQYIKVSNLGSKRQLQARVDGARQVVVE